MSARFKRYHLPALAWAFFLGLLLLTPGDPTATTALGRWMLRFSSFWGDIVAHVVLLGTMGWLAARSFLAAGLRRSVPTAAVLSSLYGALLEVAQSFVPGRGTELLDITINTLAATTCAWLTGMSWRKNGDTQL